MSSRLPTLFVSHGGGPWPFIDEMRPMYAVTEQALRGLPAQLPARPRAVLVISGHWEAPGFMVSGAAHPPTVYDYYGFPEHTYRLQYPAPGSPELAARLVQLLAAAGLPAGTDPTRGFDHGAFVPMSLMYPQADVPLVLLSLKSGYDAAEHIRLGQALAPLRDEGVLIMGSGLSYHNMRGFGRASSTAVADAFEDYLYRAVSQPGAERRQQMLIDWESAPGARLAHPAEDHLMPLLVAAGAAGADAGQRLVVDHVMHVAMASYRFG